MENNVHVERMHWHVNALLRLMVAMQIYKNKRKFLHKEKVELPQDWFGTHGCCFIVLEYQYGCHGIMCIRSITASEVNRGGIQCTLYVFEYSVNFPERL